MEYFDILHRIIRENERDYGSWNECRQRFELRYGSGEVNPMVTVHSRRLQSTEKVKDYYDAMVTLLRHTHMDLDAICATLTIGLPERYHLYFFGRKFESTHQWLRLAQEVEASFATQDNRRPKTNTAQADTRAQNAAQPSSKARDRSPPPTTPCRICKQRGIDAYHW